MTIDYLSSRETTSLIAPSKPFFYSQAKINLQHNQLKHRISTRNSDLIYFSSGPEIYALHTGIQKQELVKTLTWDPKCLDAAYGWICAGAGDGQCAFIRIVDEQDDPSRSAFRQHPAEVDELLPLDLDPDPTSRSFITHELQFLRSSNHNVDKYDLQYHSLGTEIVNSVVIHKMQSAKGGFKDEIVVLITSNDKTVRIFSLSQSKLLVTLTYVTQMNHATMSPDGDLLLAVGDKGQAFFHKRIPFESPNFGDKTFMTCGWIAIGEPILPQIPGIDACFSTGFSPSGHRCVVASEGGIIIVFDTSLVNDEMEGEDAVICVMKTSRPSVRPDLMGAARSLSFSPSPWDLLAVAEDQGRVIVLDLRSPEFVFRQTLEISVDPSDVVSAECQNFQSILEQRQQDIERRLHESQNEAMETQNYLASVTDTADRLEYAVQRQQIERDALNREVQALVENAADHLTDSERQMVDSIGLRRAQSDGESLPGSLAAPASVNYTLSSSGGHNASSFYSTLLSTHSHLASAMLARDHLNRTTSQSEDSTRSTSLMGRDYQNRSSASIAEYVQQRNIERERQRTSDRQPRRRSSVVITNSHNRNSTTNRSTLAPIGTATPTISTSPSRIPSSSGSTSPAPVVNTNENTSPVRNNASSSTPDPWQTITDDIFTNTSNESPRDVLTEAGAIVARARRQGTLSALRRSTSVSRALGTSATTNELRPYQQTMQSLLARTDLARTEMQRTRDRVTNRIRDLGQAQSNVTSSDAVRAAELTSQSRAGGVVVQGLGWSRNGRSLFVATENGMLEYKVNMRQRMQWPGVAFL